MKIKNDEHFYKDVAFYDLNKKMSIPTANFRV